MIDILMSLNNEELDNLIFLVIIFASFVFSLFLLSYYLRDKF